MKAYKVEMLVLDFEGMDEEGVRLELERSRYLSVGVMKMESRDIGEWDDAHPLNHRDKQGAEYKRLFGG